MTSFQVDATQLNELLWNCAMFTPKAGSTDGRFLLSTIDDQLFGLACDDYIVIEDSRPLTEDAPTLNLVVGIADLKTLEMWVRKAEGVVTAELQEDKLVFAAEGAELKEKTHTVDFTFHDSEFWGQLIRLVSDEFCRSVDLDVDGDRYKKWALNPERLKNIPRMKIGKDDHPVDFRMVTIDGFEDVATWQFKYGPTVVGCVMPMDREVLKEKGVALWS